METENLNSWEEFERKVDDLSKVRSEKKLNTPVSISDFLFRGQANSSWDLDTTLERYGYKNFEIPKYYSKIYAAKFEIETFTGVSWNIPTFEKFMEYAKDQKSMIYSEIPGYDYLIYLRHHGFPSPLLDWTRSRYIAAFFAFSTASKSDHISIYVYQELPEGTTVYKERSPFLRLFGPHVKSHKRHFLQQGEYTICAVKKDEDFYFSSHEEFFKNNNGRQNKVWKFNIPTSEKMKVLKKLDKHNLNAFTLFNNEESLMNTMAMRELYFPTAMKQKCSI